ncbi:DUF937 domain-containing protein [Parasulfitobacter algicola]|uniref:DUF937 domain-containing protein n=1 Tax=Parasulfitobacter algicola TaxID=2614809 RepID=A0ABX2IVY1_9RHOB|nr:DUF937 domain-containing protein [Sulfitobacter algicola]NSX56156.1 DUF937 domain-containing protein [Sulfitobacter algicola]
MSLMDLLRQAQNGKGLGELGRSFGLDEKTTQSIAEQLAPAISGGLKQRAQQEGGLSAVLGALKGDSGTAFFDDAQAASMSDGQTQGENFLTQIFGDRNAAPELARTAAEHAGAPADKVQQLLPALAAMLQGGMQKQAPDAEIDTAMAGVQSSGDTAGSGLADLLGGSMGGSAMQGLLGALGGKGSGSSTGQGGLGSLLQMLDADGDGSPLNDVIGKLLK